MMKKNGKPTGLTGIAPMISSRSGKLLVAYGGFRKDSKKIKYFFSDDFVKFCPFCGKELSIDKE